MTCGELCTIDAIVLVWSGMVKMALEEGYGLTGLLLISTDLFSDLSQLVQYIILVYNVTRIRALSFSFSCPCSCSLYLTHMPGTYSGTRIDTTTATATATSTDTADCGVTVDHRQKLQK